MAEKQNPSEEESKKSGAKNIILLAAAGLILAVGGAAGGYLLGAKAPPKAKTQATSSAKTDGKKGEAGAGGKMNGLGPMVNIDPFIVNIEDDHGTHYLKAAMTLEADNKNAAAEIKARMPEIKDAILLLIGNESYRDLSDLQGKLQLRVDLLKRLNQILKQGKVDSIYFTDFVIQ